MTEVVEYTLVVMVSVLFIGGSAYTYSEFSSFESGVQLRASFAAVSGLASRAVENGSAKATVTVPSSTIRCESGSLSMSAGSVTQAESLPLACSFTVTLTQGPHVLTFSKSSSSLVLSVS